MCIRDRIEAINLENGDISIPQTFSMSSTIQIGFITVCGGSNLSCIQSADDFSGFYSLSYIGDATGGFGIPFPEGPVTINTVSGSPTKRSFNLPWGPQLGGFPVLDFVFNFVCTNEEIKVEVEDFNTGLSCTSDTIVSTGGSITIVQGDLSGIILLDEEEIILNIIEYQDDGDCGVPAIPKTIRLIKE